MSNQQRPLLGRLLREPILHFAIIGALIYLIYAWSNPETPSTNERTLIITSGEIEWLSESFSKRWNRAPTPEERQGLIEAYIRETVLYREALAMGLDDDDVIIRRRLAQKLEFLFQDLADAQPPSEQELRQHFDEHQEQYRDPAVITFSHVFVDPDRRDDQTLDDAATILAELQTREDAAQAAADAGDQFMLQRYYPQRSELEIAKLFGREFARSVFELKTDTWHGPVLSGYGVHLVFVHESTHPPPPTFDAVLDRVTEDWRSQKRHDFNDQYIDALLARYDIVIEGDQPEQVVSTE